MTIFKRRHISFSLGVLLILSAILWWKKAFFTQIVPEQNTLSIKKHQVLFQNSSEIHRLWTDGPSSDEWKSVKQQCLNDLKIEDQFNENLLKCNPVLIECIEKFHKKKFGLIRDENGLLAKFISKSSFSNGKSGYVYQVTDGISRQEILLENNCHEILLEESQFFYGEAPKEKNVDDELIDTFGRRIYLDSRLVLNFEVNEWIDAEKLSMKKTEPKKSFDPATHLTFGLMEKFCASQGKTIMMAHFFDAATFYQSEKDVPKRSVFHWTMMKNPKDFTCRNLFSYECLEQNRFQVNQTTPSVRGLFDPMGGVLEAFKNPIHPNLNLKASSFYFKRNSIWHSLGKRAKWNGSSFDLSAFDFGAEQPITNDRELKVGFRCMREEW